MHLSAAAIFTTSATSVVEVEAVSCRYYSGRTTAIIQPAVASAVVNKMLLGAFPSCSAFVSYLV